MIVSVPSAGELASLRPEIALAVTIVALLLGPLFSQRRVNVMSGVIATAGVAIALFFSMKSTLGSADVFSGALHIDGPAIAWRQILLIFMLGVLGIWWGNTRRSLPSGDAPEFFTLLLAATLGMMLMGETSNLLMLLIATEIASMPSYVLAGFQKGHRRSAEAALKFVLFGAVCTAIMIYGLSLLYGSGGSLDVASIGAAVARNGTNGVIAIGLLLVLVGLLFKISAVPLHFWSPDVYAGAPIDVVAFLSVASKGAGIVLLLRLSTEFIAATTVQGANPAVTHGVGAVLAILAIATTTFGTLGALRQRSIRRMLAYSSISHAGYMLSAAALLDAGRPPVVMYLAIYMVMNIGAFAVLADVESQTGSDDIKSFNGLFATSPMSAVALVICLMSMVGLPPAAGFFAKWSVLTALGVRGGWWWCVAASVAINSIISLVFYARLLRACCVPRTTAVNLRPGSFAGALAVGSAIILILMLMLFSPLDRWAHRLAGNEVQAPAR